MIWRIMENPKGFEGPKWVWFIIMFPMEKWPQLEGDHIKLLGHIHVKK